MQTKMTGRKRIVEMEELTLIGFRVLCEGSHYIEEIPKAAKFLKERIAEIQDVKGNGQQIGAFVVEPAGEEEDGYWIGVEVGTNETIPEGMTSLTIPFHRYAAILHQGSNGDIRKSYEELHHWIEEERLERDNQGWNLEIYDAKSDPENIEEVCVELLDSVK